VPCNYAAHFNGTIHQRSVTTIAAAADPSGKAQEIISVWNVTVTHGRASCEGTQDGKPVKGPGQVAIERGRTWYSISVACPGVDGDVPSIGDAQIKTERQDDTTGFLKLESKLGDDKDDPAGTSTSLRADWSLVRSADPEN
jgi:hypothetical protein